MSAATETVGREAEERDPRFAAARAEGGGDEGREMVAHAAQGAKLDEGEERSALDWLLGAPKPIIHDVPVDYETPAGMAKLTFTVRGLDARTIDEIEQRHINQASGKVDQISLDIELVAAATLYLFDASGKRTELGSDQFLTWTAQTPEGPREVQLASTHMALEKRFRAQEGLLSGVAREVRRIGGYSPERVGQAQRRLVDAALG